MTLALGCAVTLEKKKKGGEPEFAALSNGFGSDQKVSLTDTK